MPLIESDSGGEEFEAVTEIPEKTKIPTPRSMRDKANDVMIEMDEMITPE